MNFQFTEAQEEFRYEFREWLEESLPDGWVHGEWQLPNDEEEKVRFIQDWQRRKYEDGWAGPNWPEEYGGMGLSSIEGMIYADELARINSPPNINSIGNLVGPTLVELGTEWQKERFVPNILNGEELWCQGYSEPEHGSDIAGLETKAEKDGDEYIINGQKIWTSRAHIADWCILMTRTDFSGTKHEGITAIIVDTDQDGFKTEQIHQISDDREFNQVYLDDVRAPEKHVVGEVDQGWNVIRTISAYEQSGTKAFELKRRLNELLHYCQNTPRNGQPLAEIPHVRQKLAEFDTQIEAAQLTAYRQASKRINNPVPTPEGTIDKLLTDDLTVELENFAMSLRGADTGLWEDSLEDGRWTGNYLMSYGMWIAAGTGDIYRNIIGEKVLGMPKDDKSKQTHRRD